MTVMAILMLGNLLIQMTPCYTMDKYNVHRITFYVITLAVCLALALSGRFYFGTAIEVE